MNEADGRSWKILLVEDDEDDYVLTRALLTVTRGDRFELAWVNTFDRALEALIQDGFDVVLVDHFLGKRTGLDLIREAAARGEQVPFIILTGKGSYELDIEATRAGATDYLVKGEVSPPLLERTIRYAIARQAAEREIGQRREHIELQHRLIEQRELERLEIAQDLHDGPLQELIGMMFSIQEVLNLPDTNNEAAQVKTKLGSVMKSLQEQVQDLRTFCGELRPPALTPYGLETAIRSHAQAYEEKHPEMLLMLNLEPDHQALPEPVRLALYRIYQELMNNINRHSGASEATISFELEEGKAILEVKDNGKGFKIPKNWIENARQGHLGLVGVQERVEAAGGIINLESKLGQGTRVRVIIPYTIQ